MSKIRYATLFLAAVLLAAPTAFAQQAETVEGQVQIKLSESAKAEFVGPDGALPETVSQVQQTGVSVLNDLAEQYQASRMERIFTPAGKHEPRHVAWGLDRWYRVEYDADAAPQSVADAVLSSAQVEEASPVYEYEKLPLERRDETAKAQDDPERSLIPNDPDYNTQWHYQNTDSNPGTPGSPGADVSLPAAHDTEQGDPDVVVAITDGGLDLDHPDIEPVLWTNEDEIPGNGIDDDNNGYVDDVHGYDFYNEDSEPEAQGDHGTHVAGTVGAKNGNGTFGAGVAGGDGSADSGVRLMATKVFGSLFGGGFADAITYSADNGAVISQNSWGGGGDDPVIEDAIEYFRANAGGPNAPIDGGLVVFAAGNDNSDAPAYPAFYEEALAVGATNENGERAVYSNYGSWVEISAPGGGAPASGGCGVESDDVQSTIDGGFGGICGTSMAAPHVSGVAGLIASANPGFTDTEVENFLIDNAEAISTDEPIGPHLNAANAVAAVSDDSTPPATITDLAATVGSSSEPGAAVDLSWTAPGDDGMTGTAAEYDIRYSTDGPIDDSTAFANATELEGEPAPDTAGTAQSYTAEGLPFDMGIHFAIKAIDNVGNHSDVSNSPSVTTPVGPVASFSPGSISTEITVGNTQTLTATLQNEGEVDFQFSFDENELPDYLSVSPSQDSLAAGESTEIDFTFNAQGLDLQVYEAEVEALVTQGGASSAATIQTSLNVDTAPFPFAVDTESIDETLENLPSEDAETVTRTVTITNEADRSHSFEIYGGAATGEAATPLPSAPFNGEKLDEWRLRQERKRAGAYDDSRSPEPSMQAYQGDVSRQSGDGFMQSDAVIPTTRLTGNATSVFGPLQGNFVDVPTDNPEAMSALGSSPTAYAGNYGYGEDSFFYVITDADNKLHEIDAETGAITTLGTVQPQSSDETWSEIAVDPTDGTLYASAAAGIGTNKLYTIDPPESPNGTVETEFVTDVNSSGLIIATAIDGTGQMYGLEIVNDQLVEIDKEDGTVTTVGPVGFNANFAQGMDFDLKTGNLYMYGYEVVLFFSFGSIYQANPETGETTFLGAPGGGSGAELGYASIPSIGFVEPALTEGTIPAGGSIEVDMTLTADRLNHGEYESEVYIGSNVAGEPKDTIDVTLNVEGEPELTVVPQGDSTIAYDSTFVRDTTAAEVVTVRNEGTADMEATFSVGDQFTADADSVNLFPGEAATVDVTFTPTQTGEFEQEFAVTSQDSSDAVALTGTGVPRPIAELSQSEFDVQMYPGQSYTRTLSMTNAGGSALEFVGMEEDVQLPSAVAPPAGAQDFEEGVPPEGWQTEDVPGEGVAWQTNEDYDRGNYTGSGLAAHVDSDENRGVPYDARLVSPQKTFDDEMVISFDLNYQVYSGNENFDLDVSTDGGASWTTVRSFEETGDYLGEGESIVIPNDTLDNYMDSGDTFQMRFRYWTEETAPWDWYAQVDNVAFSPSTEFFTFEPTEGTIQPDSTEDLTLSFNADNIASGTYEVDMVFDTNDPVGDDGDGTVTVPVTIDVIESLSVSAEPETGDKDVVYPNEEFMVPVMVESLDDLAVESYQFTMNFDGDLVEPLGVVQDSSLSEGLTLTSSLNENSVSVAAIEGVQEGQSQSSSPVLFDIEGEGALVFVNFRAEETLGTSQLSFPEVQFNEGNPPASGDTTSVEVAPLYGDVNQDLSIMSSDAMLVLDYWVGDASLSDSQFQAADVTGDGSVSALDASKIMEFTVGGIECFPAEPDCGSQAALASQEAGGGSETAAAASFAWGETAQNSQASSEGKQLAVPLVLRSTDTAVRSIQVSTTIDREKVTVEKVESQLPDGWQLTHNVAKDGTLKMALAGPTPVTQPGDVATVTLRQKESGAKMEMGGTVAVNETASQELEATSVVSIPDEFALEGTYPNPFSQRATLEMQLPEKAGVTVEVYDVLGRQVKTAYDGELQAGASRTIQINGSDLSTGTYFYRVTVEMGEDSRTESGRMTVVR